MMSGAEIYIICAALVVGGIVIWCVVGGPPLTPASSLPNHDLGNLRVSATSTAWEHSDTCDKCHSPIGHEEYMTDVCLTCGRHMNWPHSVGIRHVVRHGRWVRHQTNGMLELSDGVWLNAIDYDAKVLRKPAA